MNDPVVPSQNGLVECAAGARFQTCREVWNSQALRVELTIFASNAKTPLG